MASKHVHMLNPEYQPDFYCYKQIVFNYKAHTKVRLDNTLKFTLNCIAREIRECVQIEYQTQDGTLIEGKYGWKEA